MLLRFARPPSPLSALAVFPLFACGRLLVHFPAPCCAVFLSLARARRRSRGGGPPGLAWPSWSARPRPAWSSRSRSPFPHRAGLAVPAAVFPSSAACGRWSPLCSLGAFSVASAGFCGSRCLSSAFRPRVARVVRAAQTAGFGISVGCARGADHFVRSAAGSACRVFRARDHQPASLVARSSAMVRAVASSPGSVLAGFVSCSCPAGIFPGPTWRSGQPCSGTWSSLALATGLGVQVVVFWCTPGAPALPAAWGTWSPVRSGPFVGGWVCTPFAIQSSFFYRVT